MDRSSASPLFLGGVDAGLGGVLEEKALLLAAFLDDGVLADVEDGAVGGGGGQVAHLAEEVGIPDGAGLRAGRRFPT